MWLSGDTCRPVNGLRGRHAGVRAAANNFSGQPRSTCGVLYGTHTEHQGREQKGFRDPGLARPAARCVNGVPVLREQGELQRAPGKRDCPRIGAERVPLPVVPTTATGEGQAGGPRDYADPAEVLPEGFLDRTTRVGKVIWWAPQVTVLAHPAIGGFVSHCGWNSNLESIWFGVPIAVWPQHAEQQFNAFQLVVELGLAAEIKMDRRRDLVKGSDGVVTVDEIEGEIRKLMEGEEAGERRKKVKEVSEKSREALIEGGVKNSKNRSSTDAITDISKNMGSKIYKSNEEKTYKEEEVENINATEKNEKKRGCKS